MALPATPPTLPDLLTEARARQAAGDREGAATLYKQVVRRRPEHAVAWLSRIEIALQLGQTRRALRQCAAALLLCPAHRVALLTKRARALETRGQRTEALDLLAGLRREAPEDLPSLAVHAGMLYRAGSLTEADAVYDAVLGLRSDHAGAWLVRIEIALVQRQPARALAMLDQAEPLCPAQSRPLRIKRARALDALGRTDEALCLTAELRAATPDDVQLALMTAGLMRKTGDLAGAEAGYAKVLGTLPDTPGAWLGRIDIAQTEGDADRALRLAAKALTHLPGHAALTARQAGLLGHMGQPEAAVTALLGALEQTPGEMRLRLELARAQLQAGRAPAAEALFAACLEDAPDNDAARLGLAESHAAQDAPEAGLAVLAGHGDRSTALRLRTAELALQAGQMAALRAQLEQLIEAAPGMTEQDLLRLFKLGEQSDHAETTLAVVQAVAGRDRITSQIARFLLTRARVILPAETATGLQQALERRLQPSGLPEFRAFATALLSGPQEALVVARAALPPRRGTPGAALLGERLLDAGRAKTGFRYLRACVRRWPNAPRLRRQFLRAAIETGQLAPGYDWLDILTKRFPDLDLEIDRMHLMVHEGRLEETAQIAEARGAAGLQSLPPRQLLEVVLALGDMERATRLVREVQVEPGAGRQNATHFSTTLHGAQFNELRLFRAAEAQAQAAGVPAQDTRTELAQNFFFPAAQIVARHAGGLGPRPGGGSIPRRIVQYWNTTTIPGEVAALMQSWQAAEGFDYTCLDRQQALSFLRKAFGAGHARAFQLANSPAEECDFLRLCWLYKHGGIYADADDKLTGDPGALLNEGPGLIVTRELWGALANNVLCAPPGHPILLWALRTAGRSLLARENDGTWFKTGPGLMTRAVAAWLRDPGAQGTARDLTILPQMQLATHVQPHVRLSYKTSGQYWNARDRHGSQALVAAFAALARPPSTQPFPTR
jgi:predicted Zn-dependent protease